MICPRLSAVLVTQPDRLIRTNTITTIIRHTTNRYNHSQLAAREVGSQLIIEGAYSLVSFFLIASYSYWRVTAGVFDSTKSDRVC